MALELIDNGVPNDGFNLTIDEVRLVLRFRNLSPHQQKGILQAIDMIKPSKASRLRRPKTTPDDCGRAQP